MRQSIIAFIRERVQTVRAREQRFQNPYFTSEPSVREQWNTWARRDGWALAGIVLLIGITGWYVVLFKQSFHIQQIEIAPTQFISGAEIEQIARSYIHGRALGILPRRTSLTLSSSGLKREITKQLSTRVALVDLSVQKEFPHTVRIVAIERIPSITWITTLQPEQQHIYAVDREGVVTQAIEAPDQINLRYPLIRDPNRAEVHLNEQIVSKEYISFLLRVHEQLPAETRLHIDSYVFAPITCYEREYVAEKIFQEEILQSSSEEYKEKKREIQKQLQDGMLTIDQSLDMLEQVKADELATLGQDVSNRSSRVEWKALYEPIACDFVDIATDLHVLTKVESGGFAIYMDSTVDADTQIQNLQTLLSSSLVDVNAMLYADVRLPDRAYVK